MTMRLTITNDDTTRAARVRIRDFARNEKGEHTGACSEREVRVIPPGGSAQVYLHAHCDAVLEEVQEG